MHNLRMATPRHLLVDPDQPLCYHLVSRCVRRGWLCGFDPVSRRHFSHRKRWITERLDQLGAAFAVDIYAYAIMDNHFHLVVYYDPQAPHRWTDEEVVERWLNVCPPKRADRSLDDELKTNLTQAFLCDPARVEQLRSKLGSLSLFMKLLKQPIARRANLEDECCGHFFEQRFYSGALLSERAVLAAMAYVDLNPVRARIARTIAESKHTSIHARLAPLDEADVLTAYLAPIVSGVDGDSAVQIGLSNVRLSDYIDSLEVLTQARRHSWVPAKLHKWRDQVAALKKRQRVFGPIERIQSWIEQRGLQLRELPLP
jgi:REP element-mobilizing transposase RayT